LVGTVVELGAGVSAGEVVDGPGAGVGDDGTQPETAIPIKRTDKTVISAVFCQSMPIYNLTFVSCGFRSLCPVKILRIPLKDVNPAF
jgi:hypothetical protein